MRIAVLIFVVFSAFEIYCIIKWNSQDVKPAILILNFG